MPGVYVKTLKQEEGKFAIHLLWVEAGFSEEPETHDLHEYVYVLKGKAESYIAHERKLIGPGYCFEIPANTEHSVRMMEDVELICMLAPPRPELL